MADNTELLPASGGDLISTDSLGGAPEVKVQRVKIQTGTDGNAADVNASNPLPISDNGSSITVDGTVTVQDGGGSLTVDGSVTADTELPAAAALADAAANPTTPTVGAALLCFNGTTFDRARGDTANGLDVDVTRVPAPLSTTGGGTEATALRITVASDSTGVLSVDDNGASLTVDSPQLPAALVGGRLDVVVGAALPAGTSNIGDVDVATVPAPLNVVGSGTQATAQRVTLATDSPGAHPLYVEDDAAPGNPTGSAPMVRVRSAPGVEVSTSGDFAALSGPVEGGIWTALLGDGIPSERIGGTTANGLDVDVTRLPSLPAGTNNIGDVDIASALPAGDNNIGNVDVVTLPGVTGAAAHDAAVSGNPVLVGLEARGANHGTPVGEGDAARAIADPMGKQVVLIGAPHGQGGSGRVTLTNTTASNVLAATSDGVSRWVVTNIIVTNAHASVGTKVEIRNGTSVVIQQQAEENGGGFALANPHGIFRGSADTAITARCVTTGADVDVFVSGYKERT